MMQLQGLEAPPLLLRFVAVPKLRLAYDESIHGYTINSRSKSDQVWTG